MNEPDPVVGEEAGVSEICVEVVSGSLERMVVVQFSTMDGSGSAPAISKWNIRLCTYVHTYVSQLSVHTKFRISYT